MKTNNKKESSKEDTIIYPQVFYRYYSFYKKCDDDCKFNELWEKHIENIFLKNEIYFSRPKELNDPLDSQVRLSYDGTDKQWKDFLYEWYRRNEPHTPIEQVCYKVNRCMENVNDIDNLLSHSYLGQMGVYCMSAINNDILMWSHYASGHTGFCLQFDANNEFFVRSEKINYSKEYPIVNFFTNTQEEKYQATLLTKSYDWAYEEEWRIIDHTTGHGLKYFPEKALLGVIIGFRMLEENKKKIMDWCSKRISEPTIYTTKPIEKGFGFEIRKL